MSTLSDFVRVNVPKQQSCCVIFVLSFHRPQNGKGFSWEFPYAISYKSIYCCYNRYWFGRERQIKFNIHIWQLLTVVFWQFLPLWVNWPLYTQNLRRSFQLHRRESLTSEVSVPFLQSVTPWELPNSKSGFSKMFVFGLSKLCHMLKVD